LQQGQARMLEHCGPTGGRMVHICTGQHLPKCPGTPPHTHALLAPRKPECMFGGRGCPHKLASMLTHTRARANTRAHTLVPTRAQILAHTQVQVHVHTQVQVHVHTQVQIHVHTHARKYIRKHRCKYTCRRKCAHTSAHAHLRANTRKHRMTSEAGMHVRAPECLARWWRS